MERFAKRSLLISMPMAEPTLPNLGMELLAKILRRADESCDVLYGSLLMPKKIGRELLHSIGGQAVFVPAVFSADPVAVAEALTSVWNPGPFVCPQDVAKKRDDHVVDVLIGIDAAEACLAACLAAIPPKRYDVVAFSLTFDAQKLPSLALATKLKQRDGVAVLFGGSACDGGMGLALMEAFDVVDAVAEGDGECTILPAIAALRGETVWDSVPNCYYRTICGILKSPQREVRLPLDEVPLPNYDEYLRQKALSEYGADHTILMFESSRGCWWGEKHHCTFCGLRADGLKFRERSPEVVVEEVRRLQQTYRPDLIYAADGILGRQTLRRSLPAIARVRRVSTDPLHLFYETKSNMRRRDAALLAAAGVSEVQPGIESFSSHQLDLMRKGATALQQVECLRWLCAYGISVTYALIIGLPGERASDYKDAITLMQKLHHLPPAMQVNFLVLDQFSPYNSHPWQFGIREIRPMPEHSIIYQTEDQDWLLRATYERNYDHDNHAHPELLVLRAQMRAELQAWQRDFRSGNSLLFHEEDDRVTVYRTTDGTLSLTSYRDLANDLLRLGERIQGEEQVADKLGAPIESVRATLENLAADGLVAREGRQFLGLAIPIDVDCWLDAGLND
jgi:ribosomal peptide maturation radical SAM protein 1